MTREKTTATIPSFSGTHILTEIEKGEMLNNALHVEH